MTKSHLPYLPRNWKAGIQGATLGVSARNAHAKLANGHDDHYVRPAKRRRFMEGSPDSGIGQEIDGFVLHEDPVDIPRAMKVNVLRLFHKDLPRAKQNILNGNVAAASKDIETRARCKITITTPGDTPGDTQLLYCDSQMINIRTSQDSDGVCRTARVELPQRFDVPEEKIYVERHDDAVFDLADTYAVRVELQSAGDDYWPPLNLARTAFDDALPLRSSPRHWTLEAEIPNVLERNRRLGVMKLFKGSGAAIKTDFFVDIDVRWATALPAAHPSKGQERNYLASIANVDRELLPLTDGYVNENGNSHLTNGHSSLIEDELEDDAEGELTPGRSLRVRGSTNYNLKDLSAKAQGRAPRKRTKNIDNKKADSERVLYRLPREAIPVKEVVVDAFSCCVCHAAHESLAQLRAHLFSHAQYRFELSANPGKPGYQLDVYCVADSSGAVLRPKVYQLGRPTKPFDLDKYVEGDDSWITSRLGPNNDEGSVSGVGARKISQTRGTAARAVSRPYVRRKEKKVFVPETNQSLFDPLSKAKLVPGSEVRRPAPDESWLVQKHRDIVQDFCDVDAAEKEYIKEWDAFSHKKRISEAFIGRAVVDFVNEKINWLLDSNSRALEFGKHLTVLIARGLDEETVKLVQNRLQDARNSRSAQGQKLTASQQSSTHEAQPNKQVGRRNSPGCAVCGRHVRGPGLLICSVEGCKKPLYHDDCIRDTAQMSVDHPNWRCNDCTHWYSGS